MPSNGLQLYGRVLGRVPPRGPSRLAIESHPAALRVRAWQSSSCVLLGNKCYMRLRAFGAYPWLFSVWDWAQRQRPPNDFVCCLYS
eukprot:scaffold8832_cov139-Amphora_coffeaeformis.AAC.2